MSIRYTVEIDVGDVIDELDDEDLVEELKSRNYHVEKIGKPKETRSTSTIRADHARDALGDLMCRRPGRAMAELRALLQTYGVSPDLLDAYEAILKADGGAAICLIDRFIEPSPAAKPQKEPA